MGRPMEGGTLQQLQCLKLKVVVIIASGFLRRVNVPCAVPEVESGLEKRCLYIRTFEIGHSIASKAIL